MEKHNDEQKQLIVRGDALMGQLMEEGGQIFVKPDGEAFLLQWIEFVRKVEAANDQLKDLLEAEALKLNPNFTSITGEQIKVMYRFFGSKYGFEPGLEDRVPDLLVDREVKYKLNTKALEDYIKETGALPYGVKKNDRKKTIVFGKQKEIDDGSADI